MPKASKPIGSTSLIHFTKPIDYIFHRLELEFHIHHIRILQFYRQYIRECLACLGLPHEIIRIVLSYYKLDPYDILPSRSFSDLRDTLSYPLIRKHSPCQVWCNISSKTPDKQGLDNFGIDIHFTATHITDTTPQVFQRILNDFSITESECTHASIWRQHKVGSHLRFDLDKDTDAPLNHTVQYVYQPTTTPEKTLRHMAHRIALEVLKTSQRLTSISLLNELDLTL